MPLDLDALCELLSCQTEKKTSSIQTKKLNNKRIKHELGWHGEDERISKDVDFLPLQNFPKRIRLRRMFAGKERGDEIKGLSTVEVAPFKRPGQPVYFCHFS